MYNEPEKKKVRKEALKRAVSILTTDRSKSTIADVGYPSRVKKALEAEHGVIEEVAGCLSSWRINSWEEYYNSLLGLKTPSELKVAFLAGPNPENDIDVLLSLGILEGNIWAFESAGKTYREAVENLKQSYPNIKLYKMSISSFFRLTAIKFDIIYLDCCSPIFTNNSPKSISTLVELFRNHALSSPGVLITNFSLPPAGEKNVETRERLALLSSIWLYPKMSLDGPNGQYYPQEEGIEFTNFYDSKVKENLEYWYGEFITRLVMDISSVIVPLSVFHNDDYFSKFFKFDKSQDEILKKLYTCRLFDELDDFNTDSPDHLDSLDDETTVDDDFELNLENDDGGWAWTDINEFSIPWSIGILENQFGMRNEVIPKEYDDSQKAVLEKDCKSFVTQLSGSDILNRICALYYALFGVQDNEFFSDSLKEIMNARYWKKAPNFCDVFTEHSLLGTVLGQLSVPYHTNIDQTVRFSYKAKRAQMYTDVFVFDECRYIYDMAPTVDMILGTVDDIETQLLYRFVLDALDKNLFYYNREWFDGNAVVSITTKGFEAKELSKRVWI